MSHTDSYYFFHFKGMNKKHNKSDEGLLLGSYIGWVPTCPCHYGAKKILVKFGIVFSKEHATEHVTRRLLDSFFKNRKLDSATLRIVVCFAKLWASPCDSFCTCSGDGLLSCIRWVKDGSCLSKLFQDVRLSFGSQDTSGRQRPVASNTITHTQTHTHTHCNIINSQVVLACFGQHFLS